MSYAVAWGLAGLRRCIPLGKHGMSSANSTTYASTSYILKARKHLPVTKHHSEDQFGNSIGILAGRVHGNDALGLASFQVNVVIASVLSTSCNMFFLALIFLHNDNQTHVNWSKMPAPARTTIFSSLAFSRTAASTMSLRMIIASTPSTAAKRSSLLL